jgi:predicted outer membrane repeat protein
MKKQLAIVKKTIAAALGLLLLAACANPFITPREQENPIVEGKGLVRIGTGAGPARTALPSAVFDHYEYAFSLDGVSVGTIEPTTAGGNAFELSTGNWEVTINAYAGSGNDTLAAQGSGSFTITLGQKTEVTIKLSPIASSGTGTLNYALAFPDGAVVTSFTLTRLADTEEIDLKAFGESTSISLTGAMTVPSGYYLARGVAQKDGVTAGKSEVVHIYSSLTTELELELVEDNFKATMVVSSADSGPGTLREALTNVMASDVDGATIRIDLPEGDRVITLRTVLPEITKSLVIEGNGATLTQSGLAESYGSQFLVIYDYSSYGYGSAVVVRINRLHFKGGRAISNGAAINNDGGKITLESCVFSDNRTSVAYAYGGAIYSSGATSSLTISGCTFYRNTAGTSSGRGGAIYIGTGAATLTGNIFWGNTAVEGSVVCDPYGSSTSGGFNVSDKASGTDNTLGSGWEFEDTDKQASSLPISPVSFRPIGGGSAINRIAARPAEYPAADFYGVAIPETNAAAGAAQTATTGTGHFLDYAPQGSGTISVTSGTVDDDGFAGASVTLTAQDSANGVFRHWIVDGTKHDESSNVLALTVNKDITVRAVFYTVVTSTGDSGPGTLREALTSADDGDGIVFPAGQTITLNTPLLAISKSIIIEGNGATLTQSGFAEDSTSQLLSISYNSAAVVRISRLHFKGGRASQGAGIRNNWGNYLTLESCIFSDNEARSSGDAIYSDGTLTVLGCTFYRSSINSSGLMIYGYTATLTGNVFWGNTAASDRVVRGNSVTSGGFNVSDKADGTADSGWDFEGTDTQTSSLPVSSVSFRPIGGGDAINRISARPEGYPTVDFYGVVIPETNAAAGAAQTAVTGSGYFLDYAPQGPGTVSVTGGTVDNDGFAGANVTLTAQESANGVFKYWTVDDGTARRESSNPLNLAVNSNTVVRAVFYTAVTRTGNSGPGSLREALIDVGNGSGIVLPAGQTITLTSPLDQITKSIVIEGNGATLTQRGFTASDTSQLLYINNGAAEVRISRLLFKGGRATNYGGAIRNTGKLTLESCVFSDNQTSSNGGAIYTYGDLTVSGCTFYGNSAGNSGGAIYRQSGTVNLTGNVFWGNTAAQYSVIYATASIASGGFNVSDKADGSNATLGSGWTFEPTDIQPVSLPVSPISFKPIAGGEALSVMDTKPASYPAVDFYGATIPGTNAAAGAIQTATGGTGYFLNYAATGPGTISAAGLTMDEDGLLSSGSVVTLTAQTGANGVFMHWTVDGLEVEEQSSPNEFTVTMDDHKIVRAVFYVTVTNTGNSGPGSLREALAAVGDGSGIVLPANQIITLDTSLPQITKSIVIEGNGTTLTQSGFTASATSQLLYINSTTAEVHINRLHFKEGRATNNGAAINNTGILTLESCIFSDNRTSNASAYGGAIRNAGSLTVSGCTFYGNGAPNGQGGAIYSSGATVILTGNVFRENTASQHNVVFSSGSVVSGGFNISDKADGSDTTLGSGWTFTGDKQTALSISPFSFKPLVGSDVLGFITTKPADYPAKDFYGVAIPAANAAAGAIQTAAAGAGYLLDYTSTGPGTVSVNGTMDEDGLIPSGNSVTLTAQTDANGVFMRWIVNGVEAGSQSSFAVSMDGHKVVQAVFYLAVTDTGNTGPGTLREALTNASYGDGILLPADQTITLTAPLPQINKSIVIEGNGAILTQNGFTESNSSQLLYIYDVSRVVVVRISRLHFKGGRATERSGAIYNYGETLILESCIFSDNRTSLATATGGAIYATGATASVIVSGCTFYGNRAGSTGGAIYNSGSTITLTGNIFLGNTALQDNVVSGSVTSGGFNVSDKASGTGSAESGWTFVSTDKQASLPISPLSFKPLSGGEALSVISSRPVDYPKRDFHGVAIPQTNAAAGAIQTATATGYFLDYASTGPGTVTAGETIDDDGLISGSSVVTLTAQANANGTFMYWTVNGVEAGSQSSLSVTMDGHKTVRAVFCIQVTSIGNDGSGSLREALAAANDGDWIRLPAGQTITLTSPLPVITKSLVIEGNGATLTQNGFTISATSQLLYFDRTGADIRISRLHFKGGRATGLGAGLRNNGGNLTLESCIFSENRIISPSSNILSGALYSNGNTTISGCTFYRNSMEVSGGSLGGAVTYSTGILILTGNVFWENTADTANVVYRSGSSGSVTSGGYNVSDKASGTDSTAGSGWTFINGDTQLLGVSIDPDNFKPSHASLPVISLPLTGFPQRYFDGTSRGSASTPGAMPAQ